MASDPYRLYFLVEGIGEKRLLMSCRVVEYKQHMILIADFRNLRGQEYLDAIEEFERIILSREKGELSSLIDVSNTEITDDIAERFMVLAGRTEGYTRGRAVVGVTGVKRILARMIKREMYYARSVSDAKEWLVNNT